MSHSDRNPQTSGEQSLGDDGRSLWWAIPSAVAGVLGVAGAVIARSRRARPVSFPTQPEHSERQEAEASALRAPASTTTPDIAPTPPPVR